MTRNARQSLGCAATAAAIAMTLAGDALAASEGGLVLVPDWKILVLLVLFVALVYPLNALLFRPIFRVLDERAARISGTRQRASQLSEQADDVLQRYESRVAEVRDEAERERRGSLETARAASTARSSAARAEAETEVARAREQVAAGTEEARASLRAQSQELAQQIATRVLGREISQ